MPIHDWTKIEAGIFDDFHHAWIEEIKRTLNSGSLPSEYYAMAEQQTGPFGPDVLTLQAGEPASEETRGDSLEREDGGNLLLAPPLVKLTAEAEIDFYRRKQSIVAIRHVTGDRIVAVVEIVSRGNKSSNVALREFVDKAVEFLFHGVHLLIIDLHAPGPRDPHGIHGVIWEEMTGQPYSKPDKPLTLAAYESGPGGVSTRTYVQGVAVGERMPDMPLFLEPGAHIPLPLEMTYEKAFAALPRRWRRVLEVSSD